MAKPILLFSTTDYAYLESEMLSASDRLEAGQVERKSFPDGESYLRVLSSVDKRDVAIVGGTHSDRSTLELYDLACAIVKYGANRLTLLIPYFGYSTMERQSLPGEVIMAKTRARLLSAIPLAARGNQAYMIDLHFEGIQCYFEGPIRAVALSGMDLIKQAIKNLNKSGFVLGATDAGRAKSVERLAGELGVPPAFVYKQRLDGATTRVTGVSAAVQGKSVIIYDDMIRTGGSLIQAARVYLDSGAKEISAVASHGIFPADSLQKIIGTGIFDKIICTNSHPTAYLNRSNKSLEVVSVSSLFCQIFET